MANIACTQALIDLELSRKDLERWRRLVHSVGVAFVALTVLTIFAITEGVDPAAWVSGGAAVASGGGLGWVLTQKASANKAHKENKTVMSTSCGTQRNIVEGKAPLDDEIIDVLAS